MRVNFKSKGGQLALPCPQQIACPSIRKAHVCSNPVVTCKKGPCVSPNGGDDPGEGIVAPNLSLGFTPCFVLLFSEKEEKEEGKTLQKKL